MYMYPNYNLNALRQVISNVVYIFEQIISGERNILQIYYISMYVYFLFLRLYVCKYISNVHWSFRGYLNYHS